MRARTEHMAKPIIAVDIDDVLADHAKGFVEFSNKRWGTSLTPEDYEDDWSQMWQIDHEEVEDRAREFFDGGHIYEYTHDTTAYEVLVHLKKAYDLIIVTARRYQTKGDTLLWIRERYPGIFDDDKIFFAGIWDSINGDSHLKTKGELVKSLGARYLIDDQIKHCLAAHEQGLDALLFGNYTWNQIDVSQLDGVTRVANWAEIKEYFDGRTK